MASLVFNPKPTLASKPDVPKPETPTPTLTITPRKRDISSISSLANTTLQTFTDQKLAPLLQPPHDQSHVAVIFALSFIAFARGKKSLTFSSKALALLFAAFLMLSPKVPSLILLHLSAEMLHQWFKSIEPDQKKEEEEQKKIEEEEKKKKKEKEVNKKKKKIKLQKMLLSRWSRTIFSRGKILGSLSGELRQNYAKVAAFDSIDKGFDDGPLATVKLDKMFWSKPRSLALTKDSPLRIDEPHYEGVRRFLLKLMLFYSKQSKNIRCANVVYKRVRTQVDEPAIYNAFDLEKTFKTTFSLLVLHMWMCLRQLKAEGKDGVELGQYVYEIYNHDLELRVSKAGVNLLLHKWMKDLEKIFYGNLVAYDASLLPEAPKDDLVIVLWRNVFTDDPTSEPSDAARHVVQAMARYVRHEVSCLSLTDKEAVLSGNFLFTSLENPRPDQTMTGKNSA